MAIRVIREVNRTEGRFPAASVHIIAGQPLLIKSGGTVKWYDDTTGVAIPYGLAADSTDPLPIAPASGQTAGQGFDYTNFARGGLVGSFTQGGEFDLFDDGHGLPYVAGDTYVINGPVYVRGADGLLTSTSTNNYLIGSVVEFDGSPVTRLRIKSVI